MKFLDFFSGIGGFRLGLEMAGHECAGHCEIDKFANKSYVAIHDVKEEEWYGDDIRTVKGNELPNVDIWCFGFPCQDISSAGKQNGLDGNRSGLFFQVMRLIDERQEEDKPTRLFIENVKNLLSVNDGWDFLRILVELDKRGYDAEWQVLNTKHFGIAHNRERVFIVGHLRGKSEPKVFPIRGNCTKTIKAHQFDLNGTGNASQTNRLYETDGLAPCLTTFNSKCTKIVQRPISVSRVADKRYSDTAHCVIAGYAKGIGNQRTTAVEVEEDSNIRIRKLSPRETWRLQGFPDSYFDKAKEVNSDFQLYRQAGNSVSVPVIYEIAKRL